MLICTYSKRLYLVALIDVQCIGFPMLQPCDLSAFTFNYVIFQLSKVKVFYLSLAQLTHLKLHIEIIMVAPFKAEAG